MQHTIVISFKWTQRQHSFSISLILPPPPKPKKTYSVFFKNFKRYQIKLASLSLPLKVIENKENNLEVFIIIVSLKSYLQFLQLTTFCKKKTVDDVLYCRD